MDQILKYSVLPFTILLLKPHNIHGQNRSGDAPQGCMYDMNDEIWRCDFKTWMPPLKDIDFGIAPLYSLDLYNINGNIPAGAFSGLNGPPTSRRDTYFYWFCYNGNTSLTRDIFTANLNWVTQLDLHNCYLQNGLPSRLLENLKGLQFLRIKNARIEPLVAHDALAGLTNLRQISINAHIFDGELPHGIFDGLKNLTKIDLRFAKLTAIPPNWFNGLVNLEEIYMSFNNLLTLPAGLFDDLISLRIINLHRNPWNCSCELLWFLHWSDITDVLLGTTLVIKCTEYNCNCSLGKWTYFIDKKGHVGAVCQSPPVVRDVSFEDAFGLLGCITSTHTSISTSVTAETESAETQTSFVHIFTDKSTDLTISPRTERRTLMSIHTVKHAMPVTATPKHAATATPSTKSEEDVSSTITSASTPIPNAPWTALTVGEIRLTNTIISSPPPPAWSTMPIAAYSNSTRGSIARYRGNGDDSGFMSNLRNIILVSTAGALLVLLVSTAALFCFRCRNLCILSMNKVNNDEEDRASQDSQGTD